MENSNLTRRSFIKKSSYSAAAVTVLGTGVALALDGSSFVVQTVSMFTIPEEPDQDKRNLRVTYTNGPGTVEVKITANMPGSAPDIIQTFVVSCPQPGNSKIAEKDITVTHGASSYTRSYKTL